MAQISVPNPENYVIDQRVLIDLVHEADPSLEERPEVWTHAAVALVQPGLELLVDGFRQSWRRSPDARRAAVRILSGLANAKEPAGRLRRPYLRAVVEGYRLAASCQAGAAAAPLFVSHLLDGVV